MEITKIGHCCLLIKTKGVTILTDPGAWSTAQNDIKGVDVIVITHEHPDHFHIDSLKQVLANNPAATIITNSAVAKLLQARNISATILEDQEVTDLKGVNLAAFGTDHAVIHPSLGVMMNTGYLFDNALFYPGDALTDPKTPVKILAMPMIGPWMKMSEALDWAILLKPKICIPVHDGMLNPRQWIYGLPSMYLQKQGIKFDAIEPGESRVYED